MFLVDRHSLPWSFERLVFLQMVETVFAPLVSRRRKRVGPSLLPLSQDWLREYEQESTKRGPE